MNPYFFWLPLIVNETISIVDAYLQSTGKLTPQQAADAQALVLAAEKFIADF